MNSNLNLTIAGAMLYAGEGAKTGRTVDFTNSSPDLHIVFNKFLQRFAKLIKIG